ncbi:MAG: FAD-binding protein [Pseudomonadota bacterium]
MSGQAWTPGTEEEAAALIGSAASENRQLRLVGTGTKSDAIADEGDVLSSLGLSGIMAYNPAELVITARAGTQMTVIEQALDEHKQMLAFEPGHWGEALGAPGGQTIGGVAATNQSGSRRFVAGAARDSLLGVRFVNGRGEIIKNGGRVMKNVTGLDLVKLLAGSWGSLGFLTEVSFKVLPRPAMEKTLAITVADDSDATVMMAAAMATSADITGAAHLPAETVKALDTGVLGDISSTCLLRFEGFEASIDERIGRVKPHLPQNDGMTVIDAEQSTKLWSDVNDLTMFAHDKEMDLWKLSLPPSQGIGAAKALCEQGNASWFADWQGGLIWLATGLSADIVREVVQGNGGHATLMRVGSQSQTTAPLFQPQSAAISTLSHAIQQSLDPQHVFRSPMNFPVKGPMAA